MGEEGEVECFQGEGFGEGRGGEWERMMSRIGEGWGGGWGGSIGGAFLEMSKFKESKRFRIVPMS